MLRRLCAGGLLKGLGTDALNRPAKIMLSFIEAAERIDKCLMALRGHQRVDCLRQDLIQELLVVYEQGASDQRTMYAEQKEKSPNTKRQAEILEYFKSFRQRHGHLASYQQAAHHFGLRQKATIAKHVIALRRQGFDVETRSCKPARADTIPLSLSRC
jgi:hypothetical protein